MTRPPLPCLFLGIGLLRFRVAGGKNGRLLFK